MNIKDQVPKLELCMRLKELGVKQESYFWWVASGKGPEYEDEHNWANDGKWALYSYRPCLIDFVEGVEDFDEREKAVQKIETCSAFSVAELGVMLCAGVTELVRTKPPEFGILIQQDICPEWGANAKRFTLNLAGSNKYVLDNSEADARAKMLIYLLENKHISVEEVNEQLAV